MNVWEKLLLVRRLHRQFYHWDAKTLAKHQQRRLALILKYARQHSPFYRSQIAPEASIDQIAVINKQVMMDHFDRINTMGLQRHQLLRFKELGDTEGEGLFQGTFSVGLSSGTSGNIGLTVLSPEERQRYGCLLWARNGIPSTVRPKRVLFALRVNNPAFTQVRSFGAFLYFVDYTKPVTEMVRLINQHKLSVLAGPPSLLSMIGTAVDEISHPIKALVSYAEVLEDDVQQNLERLFQAPVVQIYQGAEGFIGSTCREGNLHVNEDVMFVEDEPAGDVMGGRAHNIVVTDLYRTTQPIIRYRLHDLVEFGGRDCSCGSCFRLIQRIHGRSDDIFRLATKSGEFCYLFPDYVRRSIIWASPDIVDYQAIQVSDDCIEIRLVLADCAAEEQIQQRIVANLHSFVHRIGGVVPRIVFSKATPKAHPRSLKKSRIVRSFSL